MARFGTEVFEYIATLVPDWRVSDDAWPLDDESHLVGIGVLRNYGREMLIVPLDSTEDEQIPILQKIADGALIADLLRIIIVYDDAAPGAVDVEQLALQLGRFQVVAWSDRSRLSEHVICDKP